jgi:integrase
MTVKRDTGNERIKHRYLHFLADAKGRDASSVDAAAKAIERFDAFNKRKPFKKFHIEQARAFKADLMERRALRTDAPLSASTVYSTLRLVRAFFLWLADQPGYSRNIRYADCEYFNPPDGLARTATAHRFKACPTLAQILAVLDAMPAETEIERRDRALVAFTILTGARDRAIVSFKLKHIDLERETLEQDPRDAQIKKSKTFTTWFFPVGDEIKRIVVEWVTFLRDEMGFGPDDPIFPKSRVENGPDQTFVANGLSRDHWANANQVRAICKLAFARAGLPYFNPHLFRNTLVQLAYTKGYDF